MFVCDLKPKRRRSCHMTVKQRRISTTKTAAAQTDAILYFLAFSRVLVPIPFLRRATQARHPINIHEIKPFWGEKLLQYIHWKSLFNLEKLCGIILWVLGFLSSRSQHSWVNVDSSECKSSTNKYFAFQFAQMTKETSQ